MDWPAFVEPFLGSSDKDLEFFRFNGSRSDSRLLRHSETHSIYEDGRLELPTEQDDPNYAQWGNWIKSETLQKTTGEEPRDVTDRSGYHILLSARVLPFQEEPLIPNQLRYLPIHKETWKDIVQRFRPHSVIVKALGMKKCYTTCLASNTGTEPVELFTAVAPVVNYDDGIAISSTHFTKSQLTLAVIYGCSEEQMKRVEILLQMSPEVRSHPFLVAGLFAELQRDRVEVLVQGLENELDKIINRELHFNNEYVPKEKRALGWSTNRRICGFRKGAKRVEAEIQTLKEELEKMTGHMKTTTPDDDCRRIGTVQAAPVPPPPPVPCPGEESAPTQPSHGEPAQIQTARPQISNDKHTKRFIGRFGEISRDLDSFLARARYADEELTFTSEVLRDELARREAHDTGQQTRASTVVGFVAMLYLPITAMATVFATPVFDFKNDWRDIRYRPVQPPDDKNAPAQQGVPVVSGYFWYYFSLSLFFSVVTVLVWWVKTQRNGEDEWVEAGNGKSGSNEKMEPGDSGAPPASGDIVTDGVQRGSPTSSGHESGDWSLKLKLRSFLGRQQAPEQTTV